MVIQKVSEGWEIIQLKEIAKQFIVPMRDKPKIFRGNIPWCRIDDFSGKYLSDSKFERYVDKEIINLMNLKIHPVGTLLVSCSADLGKCAIVKKPLVTNQTFIGIEFNSSKVDNEFFYYYMIFNSEQLNNLSSGTTISYLSRDQFETFKVKIPTNKKEQSAIAKVLSDTDTLIESLETLIEKKKEIKQGTMQELLTGKKRLPGFKEKWETKFFGELIELNKGEQLNKSELTLTGDYPDWNGGIEPSGYTNKWNSNENTITISEGGNSCGFVNFCKQKFWCGGHCYALNVIGTDANKLFIYQLLKFQEKAIMSLRIGSGLPNIQKKNLNEFHLFIPTGPKEQIAIVQVLSDMDEEINKLERKLGKYKSIKVGLMQELLTGRIRLKWKEAN